MVAKLKPRNAYKFELMSIGDIKKIRIPEDDPRAGVRALCAAYAYGRRNGWIFCGRQRVNRAGVLIMEIGRHA